MAFAHRYSWCLLALTIGFVSPRAYAAEPNQRPERNDRADAWREKTVGYARLLSQVKWSPVADGMPKRNGTFKKGVEYTGVPYSSAKVEGRYIGFDIFLKTFLAAVENPHSVLYTENLHGKVTNAECYYGTVCSAYTSYGLQCGVWYVSRCHGPSHHDGVTLVKSQSASHVKAGDIIFTPPAAPGGGSHIELVTEVTKGRDGEVTHVRVEESAPPTTRNTNYTVEKFNARIGSRGRQLYRITDLDAWRGVNRADSFLFPNYEEDSICPVINRVLLLDRGDWVPYHKGQTVKFNVMDKDEQGVKSLVIKRGDEVVEKIEQPGQVVIERSFTTCGDYTAHCVMNDGSLSQSCKFSVCDLDFSLPQGGIVVGKPSEIDISAENMNIIILYLRGAATASGPQYVFVSEKERQAGKVVIPADRIQAGGKLEVWLIGENRYGRLKKQLNLTVRE